MQKFTILRTDFSVTTEELTPTLKLKRSVVEREREEREKREEKRERREGAHQYSVY